MELDLSAVEARVVGALMEKERATPQNYPLSLNGVLMACNQKSGRDPVMALPETTVFRALEQLMGKRVVQRLISDDSRVPKYRQTFSEMFRMDDGEAAAVCVLLLRGPQTTGEIRGRTERLHKFAGLEAVSETIRRLQSKEPDPLVQQLPRQPGTKESRFSHLFSGEVALADVPEPASVTVQAENDRINQLESEVRSLRSEVGWLKAQFESFKTQFE
ncbi:MAG TPA: DUF480 domain-containing protein [Candidatus Latescibacteria bacterium]|nr:DUF480 domain-containing protein [Candidatus Latescibacterota bacterium]